MKFQKLLISLLVFLAGGFIAAGNVSCSDSNEVSINDTERLKKALMQIATENPDGFTVDATTLKPITKGFAVSLEATQNSFGEKGLVKVITYVTTHPEVNAYGGWLNTENNMYYFDATVICATKEEAEKLARDNHQIAYFDLEKMEEVRI